jgi:molybdate transport system substrate-binding protein
VKRLVAGALLLVGVPLAGAEPLRVAAAASLSDALREVAAQSHVPVVFNFGSSSILARQIEEGAPVDVFISADEAKMDGLAQRGLIVVRSRADILSNTLVVVVPKDHGAHIRSANDLAGRSLALAQPDSVPAGIYAKRYLQTKRLWDRIAPHVIPVENVRAALAAVESGNVDAAIVYRTDALISHKVRVAFEVPRAESPAIVYPAAVIAESQQKADALRFVAFLQSRAARDVFRRYGFLLPHALLP